MTNLVGKIVSIDNKIAKIQAKKKNIDDLEIELKDLAKVF